MKTYLLSNQGRSLTWGQWKKMRGCGLSDATSRAIGKLSPEMTLGELENRCIVAGREIARFALTHLRKPELTRIEYDQPDPVKRLIRTETE